MPDFPNAFRSAGLRTCAITAIALFLPLFSMLNFFSKSVSLESRTFGRASSRATESAPARNSESKIFVPSGRMNQTSFMSAGFFMTPHSLQQFLATRNG